MLFFLLYDLDHVPGVRGVPQFDKPYLPALFLTNETKRPQLTLPGRLDVLINLQQLL
jgi:hypothetical protein